MMTEASGWPPAEPDDSQATEPEPVEPIATVTASSEVQPEPEAAEAPAEAVSATAGTPDPVPPPFFPENGIAAWLEDILLGFHHRLRALEKG